MRALEKVSPCFTGTDVRDQTVADPILFCECSLGEDTNHCANCEHFSIGEFGISVRGPSQALLPTLCHFISYVIRVCSQEKMIWVYAGAIVAAV